MTSLKEEIIATFAQLHEKIMISDGGLSALDTRVLLPVDGENDSVLLTIKTVPQSMFIGKSLEVIGLMEKALTKGFAPHAVKQSSFSRRQGLSTPIHGEKAPAFLDRKGMPLVHLAHEMKLVVPVAQRTLEILQATLSGDEAGPVQPTGLVDRRSARPETLDMLGLA